MKTDNPKQVMDTLKKVIEINIADAKALIEIFEKSGDADALQRARADLAKWEAKKESLQTPKTGSE